jgi:hypothetical protein
MLEGIDRDMGEEIRKAAEPLAKRCGKGMATRQR